MREKKPRTLSEAVAFNIRKYRKIAGMTQEELAEAVGTTKSAISKYELGRRFPDANTMDDLANVFEIPSLFLIAGEDDAAKITEILSEQANASDVQRIADEMSEMGGYYRRTYLDAFNRLNDAGRKKAIERVEELAEIPKYQRKPPQEPPAAPSDGTDTAPAETAATEPPEDK